MVKSLRGRVERVSALLDDDELDEERESDAPVDREAALVLQTAREDGVARAVRAAEERVVRVQLKHLGDARVLHRRVARREVGGELLGRIDAARAKGGALVRVGCAAGATRAKGGGDEEEEEEADDESAVRSRPIKWCRTWTHLR